MFRTTLQIVLSTEADDCEPFERRRVVRALADIRRALEDRTNGDDCPPRGEAVDMLVDLTRRLRLTVFETIDVLGAQVMDDRAWEATLPVNAPPDEFEAWCAEHKGKDVGPLDLGWPGASQ